MKITAAIDKFHKAGNLNVNPSLEQRRANDMKNR